MTKGVFIVFEGISGTGKETQAIHLAKFLSEQKKKTRIVYHPSPDLKPILVAWRKNRNIGAVSEVYLLLADRSDRVRQEIRPALGRGEWVISLRNYVSALVYQGSSREEQHWIMQEFLRFEPKPTILFYFDIAPGVARDRILARQKKTDEPVGRFESLQELSKRRGIYHRILRNIPHISIHAERPIHKVHKEIISLVRRFL
jgi:dTMP kinase